MTGKSLGRKRSLTAAPDMITIYCWSAAQRAGHWLKSDVLRERADELRRGEHILWIDLAGATAEEEQLVFGHFLPVHALTLEDITRLRREPDAPPHFPKVEEFDDYLFVVVNPLLPGLLLTLQRHPVNSMIGPKRTVTQLSAILTLRTLITHHYDPVPAVEQLRSFLSRHEAQAHRGPDYLFHLILDALVDDYAPVLDHFDDSLDELEAHIVARPTGRLLVRLRHLKREIFKLRKTLIYEREVLARLIRGEFALIDEREMAYYRNVYDHLVRFSELIESSREMVSDLMQTHLSAVSNKLNEIMKALAMISTIILPMTLVTGIYGMNFKHMPELELPWGYPLSLALMAAVGAGTFLFFRWKKWL